MLTAQTVNCTPNSGRPLNNVNTHWQAYKADSQIMMYRLLLIFFSSFHFAASRLSKELCNCQGIEGRPTFYNSFDDVRFFAGIFTVTKPLGYEDHPDRQVVRAICSGTVLNTQYILTTSHFRYPLSDGSRSANQISLIKFFSA